VKYLKTYANYLELLKFKQPPREFHKALERSYRTPTEYLRHNINEDQINWDEWILYAMFTYNIAHGNKLDSIRIAIRALSYTAYGPVTISETNIQ